MRETPLSRIEEHFSKVTDPRIDRTKEHRLIDIIAIAICAAICGAEGWVDIENFGNGKQAWLKTFLELPNGIPSHDTFGRVFSLIDPDEFQESFRSWVQSIHEFTQGQVLAFDGKLPCVVQEIVCWANEPSSLIRLSPLMISLLFQQLSHNIR